MGSTNKSFESATKLYEILRIALDDLASVELDENYKVDMGNWHIPPTGRQVPCFVCLAGSVIAKSLDCPIGQVKTPANYPKHLRSKLYALDYLRQGDIGHAAGFIGITSSYKLPKRIFIPSYEYSPEKWWASMRKLLIFLKEKDI